MSKNWIMAAILLFVLLHAPLRATAQGRSVVTLPMMDRTAQSYALGDGGAYLQGLNSLGINPAGLHSAQPEGMTQYQQLPLQTSLAMLGASYPLLPFHTTVGLTYLNLRSSNFEKRNEFGDSEGSFSTQDQMFGIHLSRPVGSAYPVFLGMSVKILQFAVASQKAGAMALDLGARYRLSGLPLTLGVSAVNLGKGPVFEQQESKLPTSTIFSGAYHISESLSALGSLTHGSNEGRQEFSFGMQYWVGNLFAMRGRYSAARSDVSAGSGIHNMAMGLGFKLFGRHTLDYSFQPFDSALSKSGAVGSHRMTLTMRFAAQGVSNPGVLNRVALGRKGEGKKDVTALELKNSALQAIKNGQFAMGAMRMQQALDLEPGNRQIKAWLSKIEGIGEIMPQAQGAEEAMALTRKGVVKYVEGADIKEALGLLRQAYTASDNAQILDLLNHIERQSGQAQATRKVMGGELGLSLIEDKLKAARAAVYEGRRAAAVKSCEEILQLEPRNTRALEVLGSAYYLMGDRAKAKQTWLKALQIEPNNQAITDYLKRLQ